MSTVIGFNARFGADVSGLVKGAVLTKKEMRAVATELRKNETPAESVSRKLRTMEGALHAGHISADQFERTASRLNHTLRETESKGSLTSRMFGGLRGNLVATAAGFLSVGLIVDRTTRGIADAMDRINSQAKAARKLGFDTAGDLVGIQIAASEFSGLDARTTNTAIQRLVRRVAEAAVGAGEARGALKELKLDAKELASLSPDKQFEAVADAVAEVKSQGDAVRLTMKLVDSEGVALVNTFQAGSQAIRDAKDRADELGLSFDAVDAAQIESANDAMGRISFAVDGLFNQLAIDFAPAVTSISRDLVSWRGSVGDVSGEASKLVVLGADILDFTYGIVKLWDLAALGVETVTLGARFYASNVLSFIETFHRALSGLLELANNTSIGDKLIPDTTVLAAKELNEQLRLAVQAIDTEGASNRLRQNAIAIDLDYSAGDEFMRKYRQTRQEISAAAITAEANAAAKATSEVVAAAAKEQQKQRDQLQTEADRIRESLIQPAERLYAELSRLQELQNAGLLSARESALAEMDLLEERKKENKKSNDRNQSAGTPGGSQQGSAAAFREITRIMREQSSEGSKQAEIAGNTEAAADALIDLNAKFDQLSNSVGSV